MTTRSYLRSLPTEEALKFPFPVDRIKWRVGATTKDKTKCIPLAYVDARIVTERLDDVFGLNWEDRYSHADKVAVCEIRALVDGVWITRSDGAGETDVEADKGKLSDAFKRAGVKFGIAAYLYAFPNVWVPYTGNNYDPFREPPKVPDWASPESWAMSRALPDPHEHNDRLDRMYAAYEAWRPTVEEFQAAVAAEDHATAVRAWYEMDRNSQIAIYGVATTHGGCLSTHERAYLKSSEFYAAREAANKEKAA